ncbi:Mu-like prophage major head subunit gpT family protein [bacterium]|nr:Mu-like prophage major head subunit gpT family protein [bacterium]
MSTLSQETRNAVTTALEAKFLGAMVGSENTQPGRLSGAELLRMVEVHLTPNDKSKTHVLLPLPGMPEEWKDKRPSQQRIEPLELTIVNKRYATPTERVDFRAKRIEDILFQYGNIIAMHALRMRQHREKLIMDVLNDGFSSLAADGQFFFDTDHAWGNSGSQNNKGTTAFGETALEAMLSHFMGFVDNEGEPMGLWPDLLIVSKEAYRDALQLIASAELRDTTANTRYGTSNPHHNIIDVRWSPHVDPDNFYGLVTTLPLKPVRLQIEQEPVFEEDDKEWFDEEVMKYGAKKYEGAGNGYSELAYGSTGGS